MTNLNSNSKNESNLFKQFRVLPIVIIDIIESYVPNIVYMNLNKEYYYKYHNLFTKYINPKFKTHIGRLHLINPSVLPRAKAFPLDLKNDLPTFIW